MFVGRKNVFVGELDFALEVLAAALGIELGFMLLREMGFVVVLMVVAMQARFRRLAKAARKVVVFSTIVELHVPPDRNEQHREGQQKRTDS